MVIQVYRKAVEANVGEVIIASPDKEIINVGKKFSCNTILTKDTYKTGTDRVFAAYKKVKDKNIDQIINLQGDMPNINPKNIKVLDNLIRQKNIKIGTLASFLLKEELNLDINEIHKKGFQTLSSDLEINSDGWLIKESNWKKFQEINPKRLIYLYKDNKESALEIIDRLSPYTILISKTSDLDFIKSINTKVKFMTSVYVDTVEDAIKFIDSGVSDLLLRDWSSEQIEELQGVERLNVYERTLLSPIFSIDEARDEFDKERYFRYLNTRNVRGFRRKKTEWSPGGG